MNHKNIKMAALSVLMAAVLGVLAGCSGGDGTGERGNSGEPAKELNQEPSPNPGQDIVNPVTTTAVFAVMINEVMAANFHGAADSDGDAEDWVELYNPGSEVASLAGYGLSNKAGSPFRWVFPAGASIGPQAYLRVWLSKKDRIAALANLHTNFNLDNGADEVLLTAPNGSQLGQLLDSVTLPMTNADVSYCRANNGVPGSTFSFCETPTPGSANQGASAVAMLEKPSIKVASGIYPSARTVNLSGPAAAQLRYTLDGSEPKANSPLYSTPVVVNTSAVLRARAFGVGMASSLVETATYVIDSSNRFAGQRVLFVNLSPEDMRNYQSGERTPNGWSGQAEMLESDGRSAFRGNIAASDSGQGGSRNGQENMPLDVKFSDALGTKSVTYPIFPTKPKTVSFKRFKLRNSGDDYWYAHMRDQYWQSVLADKLAPGAASSPVQVFANGAYYGMMDLREKEDETLIESTYGVDKDSVDYINQTLNIPSVLSGENALANYEVMRDFILRQSMFDPANYEKAKGMLDMENFSQDYALHMFAVSRDWLDSNVHLFRMPAYDGKWRYRPHDFDISSGGQNAWGTVTDVDNNTNDLYQGAYDNGELLFRLLDAAEFRALYINVIADQLNSTLLPAVLNAKIDAMVQTMRPYMTPHYAAFPSSGSMGQWDASVAALRYFVNNRATYYEQHTQAKFVLTPRKNVNLAVSDPSMGTIKINTLDLSSALTVANAVWTGGYFPEVPARLQARPRPGYIFVGWRGASTSTQPVLSIAATGDGAVYTAVFARASSVSPPAITRVGSQSSLTGELVNFAVAASDPAGLPLTYSAKKLPSGLSIHPETGMIYGRPTKSDTYATTVTVTNGVSSQSITIDWTVANRGG